MKIELSIIVLLLLIASCNVNTTDGGSKSKTDSLFEKIMNAPCDTNSVIRNPMVDSTSKIAQLETKISLFSDPDDYEENLRSARLLQKIDPYNEKAVEHIFRYYKSKKIDSVSLFFDKLISKYPQNAEPLLLRANMLFFELENNDDSLYFVVKEKYLIKAYSIDPKNVSVCFNLGELYYEDFLKSFEKKPALPNSADKALQYLNKTINLDSTQLDHLFFPISQLKKFKDNTISITLNPLLGIENNCYMPSWYFANLSENWEKDFKTNYLFLIEKSSWQSEGLKEQLNALNEPCLYNLAIPEKHEVYRFTWLKTFGHPIAVRVVKSGATYDIFWKVGKGAGGYEPEGIKECGKRELTEKEWSDFKKAFNKINFENLLHSEYEPGLDGATYTLERAIPNNYKAYNTKAPNKIGKLCTFMLKMTAIEIDKKRINK